MKKSPSEIFPEYILVRVNEFNKVAVTPLEEWVAYLKNGIIKDDTTAPGLQEARKKLLYYSMTDAERYAYDEHINAVMIQNDVLGNARDEGMRLGLEQGIEQGIKQGIEQGIEQGKAQGVNEERQRLAKTMLGMGESVDKIAIYTGLSKEEIEKLGR